MLSQSQRGFTLIELMVTISIAAILMMIAVPSMSAWLKRAGINTAAESIKNGLQMAQEQAIRQNSGVDFVLLATTSPSTSDSTTAAASSTTGWNSWVVRQPSGGGILKVESVSHDASGATLETMDKTFNQLTFSGFGRVQDSAGNALGAPAVFRIAQTSPAYARCVYVTPAAAIRICDPSQPSDDPRGCGAALTADECPAP